MTFFSFSFGPGACGIVVEVGVRKEGRGGTGSREGKREKRGSTGVPKRGRGYGD